MKEASSNYFFNNLSKANQDGIGESGPAKMNYFSQNRLLQNRTVPINDNGTAIFFNPPLQ